MAQFARSLAVVIGINQYENGISLLQTAVNDAGEIARILEQEHKYDKVWLLLDGQASLQALQQLLNQELLQSVQPDHRLLFYFAGHGIALNGEDGPEGFLIPQDAKLGDTKSYLPMALLQTRLNDLPCRHFLVDDSGSYICVRNLAGDQLAEFAAERWNGLSFTPDSTQVFTTKYDSNAIAQTWKIESFDQLMTHACRLVRDYLTTPSSDASASDRQLCKGS